MNILKTEVDGFLIKTFDNDWVGIHIQNNKSWERHIEIFLKRNLTNESILIDVGSNYGWHSIFNSKICSKIYSFEPQKIMYDIQLENLNNNNIFNVELFNCALGDKNETKSMSPINYNSNSINIGDLSVGLGGDDIEIKTIDNFNIKNVNFIKIDVQGYEKYVLLGGEKTISEFRPIIIIEIENHHLMKFNYRSEDLFKLLRDLNYEIFLLDYHYPSDHVCVPKEQIDNFLIKNKQFIKPLTESNNLNNNLENGIFKKITIDEN